MGICVGRAACRRDWDFGRRRYTAVAASPDGRAADRHGVRTTASGAGLAAGTATSSPRGTGGTRNISADARTATDGIRNTFADARATTRTATAGTRPTSARTCPTATSAAEATCLAAAAFNRCREGSFNGTTGESAAAAAYPGNAGNGPGLGGLRLRMACRASDLSGPGAGAR